MLDQVEGGLATRSEPAWGGIAGAVQAIGTDGFFTALLDCAKPLIRPDAAMVLHYRSAAPPAVLADELRPGERKYLYGDYLSGVYLLSPFYRAAMGCTAPAIGTLAGLAPEGFRRSEYFRAYFGRIGVKDMAGLFLPVERQGVFHLSYSRGAGEAAFGRAEIQAMGELLPVLAACLAKHLERSPQAVRAAADWRGSASDSLGHGLTAREREVMNAFLAGHSAKSIARSLAISVETVRVHRKHIYAKLGVASQAELFGRFLASVQS